VIIKTPSSVYQVDEEHKTFRRVHASAGARAHVRPGEWYRFERMSPVVTGEPVRFFWLLDQKGVVARIGVWATGPVLDVVVDPSERGGKPLCS
jgi:hypothetical protein